MQPTSLAGLGAQFCCRYVEEALKPAGTRQAARVRQGEKVLILCRTEERDLAESLREHFAGQGALADVLGYEEALRNEQLAQNGYTTFIGIQPKTVGGAGNVKESLFLAVERLQIIAGLACRAQAKGPANTVVFIQFGGGFLARDPKRAGLNNAPQQPWRRACTWSGRISGCGCLILIPWSMPPTLRKRQRRKLPPGSTTLPAAMIGELIRRVPRLTLQEPLEYTRRAISWSVDDVILVTGGAKGITAACALALARQTGVRMALVGSSPHPEAENGAARGQEIAQTLARFQEAGLSANYYQCDIVDRQAVQSMVWQVRQELGAITGVMHGSALNKPRDLATVSTNEAFDEISPKVLGAVNPLRGFSRPATQAVHQLFFHYRRKRHGAQRLVWLFQPGP